MSGDLPAGLTIRPISEADWPDFVRLFAALQDFELPLEPNRLPGEECAEAHVTALMRWTETADGAGVLLALDACSEPVGFVVYGVDEAFGRFVLPENQRFGLIADLFVAEHVRGCGVGAALIRAAERRLAAAGLRRVEISAISRNAPARAIYQRLGFEESYVTYAKALPPPPGGAKRRPG